MIWLGNAIYHIPSLSLSIYRPRSCSITRLTFAIKITIVHSLSLTLTLSSKKNNNNLIIQVEEHLKGPIGRECTYTYLYNEPVNCFASIRWRCTCPASSRRAAMGSLPRSRSGTAVSGDPLQRTGQVLRRAATTFVTSHSTGLPSLIAHDNNDGGSARLEEYVSIKTSSATTRHE